MLRRIAAIVLAVAAVYFGAGNLFSTRRSTLGDQPQARAFPARLVVGFTAWLGQVLWM